MGEVYRATDTNLGRQVAIKVLPEAFATHAERLARFDREAKTLASLNHPHIAQIHGLERADGIRALVMELIEGPTLADRVAHAPMPLKEALTISRQIADALDAAHERGIVHRDLKPANVKITSAFVVKVLDFGLAKPADAASLPDGTQSPTMTAMNTGSGVILGTAAYMSPEQARGQTVDKRTDIWAFGCVLYEMLTGRSPFQRATVTDTLAAIVDREPDWSALPASTSPAVRHLLRRCLNKDPKERLRDIGDARAELKDHAGDSFHPTSPEAANRSGRARMLLWSGLAATVGVGTTLLAVVALPALRGETEAVPAFDRFVRLVSTPAYEFAPAISPDGKWVAYLSDARGVTDVWVKFVAGGDPANLTASAGINVQSSDYISGLDISPDGTQIVFAASRPGQARAAWVIPAPLGGVPRPLLTTDDSGVHWSPDGTRIAFTRGGGTTGDALGLADADGQNIREIVPRQNGRHIHWIRWSPDAEYLYFNYGIHNFNTEPTEIFRVPASGGAIEPVVQTARRAAYPFPSPDGRGLYYSANPDSVDLSLWWRDLRTGRDHRLTTGVGEYGAPSVSPDGRLLVATAVDARQSLVRARVAFDRPVGLEPLTDGFTGDFDPSWSPDQSRLLFSSSRNGNRHIWAANANLSQPIALTSGSAIDERPVFSPDGRQVAFVSDRGGRRGIWLVGADGGAPRLVLAADVLDTISWSPDGRELVYSTPGPHVPGLAIVSVADGSTRLVPTPTTAHSPAWAPRGDVIAYMEVELGPGGGAFPRLVSSGSGQPRFTDLPSGQNRFGNGLMAWSADGRRLAVAGLPGARAGYIWIFEPGGTTPPRKLLDLPTGVFLRGMAWSRDGSSLILGRVQWSSDIVLAEHSATAKTR